MGLELLRRNKDKDKDKKKLTSRKIAELAEVSQTTVSMILNGKSLSSFSDETILKVTSIAENFGYVGNAKKAPFVHSGVIQIICPVLLNPYYSTLIQAVEQAAYKHGFRTMVCTTYRSADIEKCHIDKINPKEIAGIIFVNIPLNIQRAEEINREVPVVVIGDRYDLISVDMIEVNSYRMGTIVADHLLELGHRNIMFITTPLDKDNTGRIKRMEGIQDTLKASGQDYRFEVKIKNTTSLMDMNDPHIEHEVGYSIMKECLSDTEITAIVGINDMVAYGAADALLEAGYRIPEDYSICGFDNIFISALKWVSLTSVDNFLFQRGNSAFEMLLVSINQRNNSTTSNLNSFSTKVEYHPQLVIRSSTGPVRER